jgi:hypothetical protein
MIIIIFHHEFRPGFPVSVSAVISSSSLLSSRRLPFDLHRICAVLISNNSAKIKGIHFYQDTVLCSSLKCSLLSLVSGFYVTFAVYFITAVSLQFLNKACPYFGSA